MYQKTFKPVRQPEKMISYWKKEWKTILIVAVTGFIFDGGMSLVPLFQGRLLDSVIYYKDWSTILMQAGCFLGVVLLLQFNRAIKRYGVRRFANQTGAVMRLEIYHNILHRRFDELVREEAGDLLNKAVNDVDLCAEGMRKVTTEFFDSGVLMIGYLIALLAYDWRLTLPSCFFILLAMFIANKLKGVIVNYNKEAREQSSQVANLTYSDVEHIMLYRIDSVMDIREREYEEALQKLEYKSVRANILENSMLPVYNVISMLGIGIMLYIGGGHVIKGIWTVGTFIAYIATFTAFAIKASKASQLFNSFQKAVVSWNRVKPYLVGNHADQESWPITITGEPGLEVKDLHFAYPGSGRFSLTGDSFRVQASQFVGVTGSVASGKSSLGIALTGAYDYQGSIRVSGQELRELSSEARSKLVAYQGHASQLLSDTIYENITLGRAGDISEVLQTVCFDVDLDTMPEGISTIVGAKGVRLSGGQQARLALARALWQQTPLLILDDPFSAVDTKTERQILNHLKCKYQDRIFVILSHRLEAFATFDQILFMDNGVIHAGTHQQLLAEFPEYAQLYQMQKGGAPDA